MEKLRASRKEKELGLQESLAGEKELPLWT
jgi:hypothetical protein